jgi:hypothetical protein
MKRICTVLVAAGLSTTALAGQSPGPAAARGIRGDPAAIADAEAMVETMGGMTIWAQVKSVHFVHEWYPWNRVDSYVEDEVLDLTAPRSWVSRKSEVNHAIRAYSPEGRRWTVTNGVFALASAEALESDLRRAPFNFYRLVKAVAAGDPFYEVGHPECEEGTHREGDAGVPVHPRAAQAVWKFARAGLGRIRQWHDAVRDGLADRLQSTPGRVPVPAAAGVQGPAVVGSIILTARACEPVEP